MNEDIDRLNAENDLKRVIRGDDYDTIYDCITTCKRWKSHADTNDLINDGYDRLKEIRPNQATAIADEQYKDLPYMGMKKYLRNNGVAREEVDRVPGPYYKYELGKVFLHPRSHCSYLCCSCALVVLAEASICSCFFPKSRIVFIA